MVSPGKFLGFAKFFQIDLIAFVLTVILIQWWVLWKCSWFWLRRRYLAGNAATNAAAVAADTPEVSQASEVTAAANATNTTANE